MANSFSTRTYKIDTAITSTEAVDSTGSVLQIPKGSRITWVGATTAAHAATITDGAGNVVFAAVANAANFMYSEVIVNDVMGGFFVPTIASGTIYIYIASGRSR